LDDAIAAHPPVSVATPLRSVAAVEGSPSPFGRLRSWLRVVVVSCYHERSSYRGLSPHLQRAHAGRTPEN
jgi:hypothetical protein